MSRSGGKIVIKVSNLHFSYQKDVEVLKGLNLEIDRRSTAIIGQNGAGKTTFVKLLKGLLLPTKGDIWIKDYNTREKTAAFLSQHIGLVFQNPNDQIFKDNVLDEVRFGPANIGFDENEAREMAEKSLETVGLLDKKDLNPYDLTLSERKLVSIASILAMDTDIIIFDEPTIAQDFAGRQKVKKIILDLIDKGKLVITIIHDMDFVAEIFERTIVFYNGNILLDGNTREVFSHKEELKKAYLEPPHVTQLANRLGIDKVFLNDKELTNYLKHHYM